MTYGQAWTSLKIILATYLLEFIAFKLVPQDETEVKLRVVRLWKDVASIGMSDDDIRTANKMAAEILTKKGY